jgi:hypothetical protein
MEVGVTNEKGCEHDLLLLMMLKEDNHTSTNCFTTHNLFSLLFTHHQAFSKFTDFVPGTQKCLMQL